MTENASRQAGSAGNGPPEVGVVMGSASDLQVLDGAIGVLQRFGVAHEVRVVSAHRTPAEMLDYARSAAGRGLRVLVAGAGGAAHLPGMLAAATTLPVVGVPVALAHLEGLDSLLSIAQMPRGVPVATVAVNGAANAALLAVRILALGDPRLAAELDAYQRELADHVREQNDQVARRRPAPPP